MGSLEASKPLHDAGSTLGQSVSGTMNDKTMPIAVIGMSCRLPGDSDSPQKLWDMLSRGASGWSQGAGDRFRSDAFHHPAAGEISGTFNAQGFHLLKQDVAQFDAQFFNISPMEAKSMDPQQRFLLEIAYESFENSGLTLEQLSGSNTGVYVASFNCDYERMLSRDPENSPSYRGTGTGLALLSNRLSYFFNLKGPSLSLDTACSGSLVALHLACQSLRNGEVDQALVGGVNLILDPDATNSISSLRMLGDAGRCFSFDDRAQGYGRGEGLGAVVLKPLSKALQDGDNIRSIIRNTAVNQDGKTQGITVPSRSAQEAMIYRAYAGAGLDPRETSYVEAHGTGTKVGDVIEAAAIAAVFSEGRDRDNPVFVGSIKSNIGHTESTAGLAGLIKTILMLERGMILPNHDFEKLSSRIPISERHLKIPKTLLPWPISTLRRASVSSFGYGGTNGHVILDSAEDYLENCGLTVPHGYGYSVPPHCSKTNGELSKNDAIGSEHGPLSAYDQRRRLFILSSNSKEGLRATTENFSRYATEHESSDGNFLDDLAYTLCSRRTLLRFRIARNASGLTEVKDLFTGPALDEELAKPYKVFERPSLCFVFTGQGAQWQGMGCELFGAYPVFENSIAAAELHFTQLGADWSLKTELLKTGKDSRISMSSLSQASSTAVQLALVDLFRSWNIRPNVVVGHSSGEIVAAYSAGGLSFKDALTITFHRGRLVEKISQRLPGAKGAMLAVGTSADQALEYIEACATSKGKVCIACINSPSSVTISGDLVEIMALQDKLERERIFNRRLIVDTAYHSHHMELIYSDYIEALRAVKPRKFEGSTHMISTVSGEDIDGEALDGTYWARNLVSPVRFSGAFGEFCKWQASGDQDSGQRYGAIVEIGPASVLAGPVKQIQKALGTNMRYDSALVRNIEATKTVLEVAGSLFTQGVTVDFDAVNLPPRDIRLLGDYPSYAWDHSNHWHESRLSTQYRKRQHPRHSLLGVLSDNNPLEPKWRNCIRTAEIPWVKGHAVQGKVVFPGSGYICMAIEAVRQQARSRNESDENVVYVLRDINITRALFVPDDAKGVETIFSLRPYPQTARSSSPLWNDFRMFSVSGNDWVEHCRGFISIQTRVRTDDVEANRENEEMTRIEKEKFVAARQSCDTDFEPSKFYDHLKSVGLDYTGLFKGLTDISTKPLVSLCTLRIPDVRGEMPGGFDQPHCLHPVTLDLIFQTFMPALLAAGELAAPTVINSIEELSVSADIESAPGTEFLTTLAATKSSTAKYRVDMDIQEMKSPPSVSITGKGLVYSLLSQGLTVGLHNPENDQRLCHRIEWFPDITSAVPQDARKLCAVGLVDDELALYTLNSLEVHAQSFIRKALASIEPADEEKMLPHHKSLLRWMRKNALTHEIGQDPGPLKHFGAIGEMLGRVGVYLPEILRGKIHPLTVMMEGDLLYRFYSNGDTKRCIAQVAEYVRLLALKNPAMKVLEIGAGTGSATIPLLEAVSTLSGHSNRPLLDCYVFTDISPGFFEKAKKLLGPWESSIEYKKLDIEQPLKEQGFEEGCYDLIIACNVLHATKVMSNTMQNVRKLLKLGGKVVLVESTRPSLYSGLIFGTLEGWWLGADDGRVDSPLLSAEQWGTLFKANGFSGVDLLLPDHEIGQGHQFSALISTAVEDHHRPLSPRIEVVHRDMKGQCPEDLSTREGSYARQIANHFIATMEHLDVHSTTISQIEPENRVFIVMLEIDRPFLSSCLEAEFEQVKKMLSMAKAIVWITNGGAVECKNPLNAVVTGLARTTRSENHLTDLITLDIDTSQDSPKLVAQMVSRIVEDALAAPSESTREFEYAIRDGLIQIPRLIEDGEQNKKLDTGRGNETPQMEPFFQHGRTLALRIGTPGLLESLVWAEEPSNKALAPDEVRLEIRYGGINFPDLMVALGQMENYTYFADECSGVILEVGSIASKSLKIGDRVCAVGCGAYASSSVVKALKIYPIPDSMSFETAASIPVAYTTAYYSLKTVANLQKGESVLIHSAAGGLGQAAVMIAKHLGATIYITVGNSKEKSFMMNNCDIPEQNIFSSRLTTFRSGIKRLTCGKGVDVILNSLAADTLRESCACLAKFGRFLEVGKRDASENARLIVQLFNINGIFAAVDLSLIYAEKPLLFKALLGTVIDLIHTGAVGHIKPIEVMPFGDVERAYGVMQTGCHIGKIVLKADTTTQVKVLPSPRKKAKFREDSWYVVVGGTGGLGQAIIRWMAGLGAKNIIAISRSGATGPKSVELSKEMAAAGINLLIHRCDITDSTQVHGIHDLAAGKPISGIFQGAMSLNDALVENMSYQEWRDTIGGKVKGTQNLHNILGDSLDFFILLSSISGIVGAHGQGNYAAGNTFLDAFARHLSSKGFPARSLDLGEIAGVGYTADHLDALSEILVRHGVKALELEKVMALLSYAIEQPLSQDVSRSQMSLGLGTGGSLDSRQRFDGKFSLLRASRSDTQGPSASKETVDIAKALSETKTMQEAVELVCKSIIDRVSGLLAIAAADLSPSQSLSHYGADSLVALELRNWLALSLKSEVPLLELLSTASIRQLSVTVASKCKIVPTFAATEQD